MPDAVPGANPTTRMRPAGSDWIMPSVPMNTFPVASGLGNVNKMRWTANLIEKKEGLLEAVHMIE